MFNGVGVPTARGTGTSGYVQANRAYVTRRREALKPPNSLPVQDVEKSAQLQDYDKNRFIECELLDFEEELREHNDDEEYIQTQLDRKRTYLERNYQSKSSHKRITDTFTRTKPTAAADAPGPLPTDHRRSGALDVHAGALDDSVSNARDEKEPHRARVHDKPPGHGKDTAVHVAADEAAHPSANHAPERAGRGKGTLYQCTDKSRHQPEDHNRSGPERQKMRFESENRESTVRHDDDPRSSKNMLESGHTRGDPRTRAREPSMRREGPFRRENGSREVVLSDGPYYASRRSSIRDSEEPRRYSKANRNGEDRFSRYSRENEKDDKYAKRGELERGYASGTTRRRMDDRRGRSDEADRFRENRNGSDERRFHDDRNSKWRPEQTRPGDSDRWNKTKSSENARNTRSRTTSIDHGEEGSITDDEL